MKLRSIAAIGTAFFLWWSAPLTGNAVAGMRDGHLLHKTDIVIDAGHGGIDGGAVYGSLLEKDINLAIAKKLYTILNEKSISVVLNRKGDYALSDENSWLRISSRHKRDLAQRAHLANELHPRLLVSIHMNTSGSSGQRGPLVIQQKNTYSRLAAILVQQSLNRVYGTAERPVTGTKYYLLNHSECPAIIAELGYLTNSADRERLTNPKEQQRLALALGAAIEQYLLTLPIVDEIKGSDS